MKTTYETPQNLEAEQSTLGACLMDTSIVSAVRDTIAPDDFYRENHKKLYKAILAVQASSEPVDIVTVSHFLRDKKLLDDTGGSEYLSQLIEACPSSANWAAYAAIVVDASRKRQFLRTIETLKAEVYAGNLSANDILARGEQQVMELARSGPNNRAEQKRLGELFPQVLADLEDRLSNKALPPGIPTGLRDIDRITGGMQRQELIVIAARPSMGKTALALQIGTHVAVHEDLPVLVFSMEMKDRALAARVLSNETRINSKRIQKGDVRDYELETIVNTATAIESAPIFIEDAPLLKVSEMASITRRFESEHGKIGLIVIDYLALFEDIRTAPWNATEQAITQVVQGCKTVARERDCPVVLLSQLSREVEKREDKRPMMSDMKGSGSIEAEADQVWLIYRDGYYRRKQLQETGSEAASDIADDVTEIILGKQRNGATGTIELGWTGSSVRFDDIELEDNAVGQTTNGYGASAYAQHGYSGGPAPVYQGPLSSRGIGI